MYWNVNRRITNNLKTKKNTLEINMIIILYIEIDDFLNGYRMEQYYRLIVFQ